MKISDYLTNKDVKISEKDFDIEKLEADIRKGYVKETDVESQIESRKKTWEAESNKAYNDLKTQYDGLKTSYDDTVGNLNKANQELASERLKTTMMSHGFKKEQFEEVAKLRSSLFADEKDLPVNPLTDKPKDAVCHKCGSSNFIPESDVMDTWATSSLTPQICTDIVTGKGLSDDMIPMNLRPNAHDNIRVWDFYTVVKSLYHFGKLPWNDVMISGYVTSADGTKLSKKSGNNKNSPQDIIAQYSADVTRYWANNLSLGKDSCF